LTFDPPLQVNSVHDNHYREWRGNSQSRQKRATDAGVPYAESRIQRRLQSVDQLVSDTRKKRGAGDENQLRDPGTQFQVNVNYRKPDGIVCIFYSFAFFQCRKYDGVTVIRTVQ